jgi:3-hydroxy-3-methylglutaryl CoA synthase
VAAGVSVARLRLERAAIADAIAWLNPQAKASANGARAVCNWDEDAVTLAVEAARTSLLERTDIATLRLASTTLPFADRDHGALVATALDLSRSIATREYTGSLRAGLAALVEAASATQPSLVIASDARPAKPGSSLEMSLGAGAAALQVQPGHHANAIATLLGSGHYTADFVDHYRSNGASADYVLEERWVREEGLLKFPAQAIATALLDAGVAAADVRHFVMPGTAAVVKKIAEQSGCKNAVLADTLHADCGDTGAAHPLLMLLAHLATVKPGELVCLVSFAQGAEAVVLRAEAGAPALGAMLSVAMARRSTETIYTRYLSHAGLTEFDFGMRAERDQRTAQSVAWRKSRAVTAFIGGRCSNCNTVQYPMSRICVNPACRETDTQTEFRLADSLGRVKTFTEDWLAYSARPPYIYGNVEFAAGGNLLAEFTDLGAGELAVGDSVRFVFRIKDFDRQRGFRRYAWKATKS